MESPTLVDDAGKAWVHELYFGLHSRVPGKRVQQIQWHEIPSMDDAPSEHSQH